PATFTQFFEQFFAFADGRVWRKHQPFQHGSANKASPIPNFLFSIAQVVHVAHRYFCIGEPASNEVWAHNPRQALGEDKSLLIHTEAKPGLVQKLLRSQAIDKDIL